MRTTLSELRHSLATHFPRKKRKRELRERLAQKIRKLEHCWMWLGAKTEQGYGIATLDNGVHTTAHRAMWIAERGQIPKGLHVLHACDMRDCVNVDHLWLGTQKENLQDMVRKNRARKSARPPKQTIPFPSRGERNPRCKLTERGVREIRLLLSQNQPRALIMRQYGISRSTLSHISVGRTWAWL